jgi:hypothetical protein
MKRSIWLVLVIGLMLSSCVVLSFHPLYTPETVAFRQDLVGTWHMNEDETWNFTALDGELPGYYLTHISDRDTAMYNVHLVQLNDYFFLDISPDLSETTQVLSHPYPLHSFYKLEFLPNGDMTIYIFDSDYLKQLFEQRKIRIKHEYSEEDETYVLTAPTSELQAFILKYADDPKAFIEPGTLKRIQ